MHDVVRIHRNCWPRDEELQIGLDEEVGELIDGELGKVLVVNRLEDPGADARVRNIDFGQYTTILTSPGAP